MDTWLETIRMLRGAGGEGGTELQKQESVDMNLGIPGVSLRSQNIQEFFHLNGPAETMWIFHLELSVIFYQKKYTWQVTFVQHILRISLERGTSSQLP